MTDSLARECAEKAAKDKFIDWYHENVKSLADKDWMSIATAYEEVVAARLRDGIAMQEAHIQMLSKKLSEAEAVAGTLREQLAQWMIANGFATGHGDSFADLLKELDWQVKERRKQLYDSESLTKTLREELESVRLKHEEDEASVCPEDIGFVEYIKTLTKRLAESQALLAEVKQKIFRDHGYLIDADAHHCKDALNSALAAAREDEREKFSGYQKFAGQVLLVKNDWACGLEGYDIEKYAIEAGLIEQIEVAESCGEDCECAVIIGFPTECNRLTEAGKTAVEAIRRSAGKGE